MNDQITMPKVAQEGEACPNCAAPMAADQRYCLNCGARRGEPRVPFDRYLGSSDGDAALAEALTRASERSNEVSPLGVDPRDRAARRDAPARGPARPRQQRRPGDDDRPSPRRRPAPAPPTRRRDDARRPAETWSASGRPARTASRSSSGRCRRTGRRPPTSSRRRPISSRRASARGRRPRLRSLSDAPALELRPLQRHLHEGSEAEAALDAVIAQRPRGRRRRGLRLGPAARAATRPSRAAPRRRIWREIPPVTEAEPSHRRSHRRRRRRASPAGDRRHDAGGRGDAPSSEALEERAAEDGRRRRRRRSKVSR